MQLQFWDKCSHCHSFCRSPGTQFRIVKVGKIVRLVLSLCVVLSIVRHSGLWGCTSSWQCKKKFDVWSQGKTKHIFLQLQSSYRGLLICQNCRISEKSWFFWECLAESLVAAVDANIRSHVPRYNVQCILQSYCSRRGIDLRVVTLCYHFQHIFRDN